MHTRDAPIMAAQGVSSLLEEMKTCPVTFPLSSSSLLKFEEIRLSLYAQSFHSLPEEELKKRRTDLSWRLWELLLKDNFTDKASWAYRFYLPSCPELSFLKETITILNTLKMAMRDYNMNESTISSVNNSITLPLRALLSKTDHKVISSLLPPLPPSEDIFPFNTSQNDTHNDSVHLRPLLLKFLYAMALKTMQKFQGNFLSPFQHVYVCGCNDI